MSYIWIYLKLRKYCNFETKNSRHAWHVVPVLTPSRLNNYIIINHYTLIIADRIRVFPRYTLLLWSIFSFFYFFFFCFFDNNDERKGCFRWPWITRAPGSRVYHYFRHEPPDDLTAFFSRREKTSFYIYGDYERRWIFVSPWCYEPRAHSRHREKPDRGLRDALIITPAVATSNLVFNFSGNRKKKKKKNLAITMPVFAVYKFAPVLLIAIEQTIFPVWVVFHVSWPVRLNW